MMDVHGLLKCLANPALRGKKQFAGIEARSWERRRPAGQFKFVLQHAGGTPALPEDALRKIADRKTAEKLVSAAK
jgi:hypothetical protein